MPLRALLKDWTPPAFVRLIANVRGGLRGGAPWSGVYAHRGDVPQRGSGYTSAVLARRTRADTERLLHATRGMTMPHWQAGVHSLLALTASLACRRTATVRVLDFGGGMGVGFIHLVAGLRSRCDVEYHVVETPAMCDGGRDLFKTDSRIQFHSELPTKLSELQIVYVSSALQYVDDYVGLLQRLCAYQANHILLTNFSAGEIPTYATSQRNMKGSELPYWFFNAAEITDLLRSHGYSLDFSSLVDREYDRANFPAKYRLTHMCNLLFSRMCDGEDSR